MGQYHLIVNPSKMQYLDPHNFGCGLKLMEFTNTPYGPQAALCILLAISNGRGGGDLEEKDLTPAQRALIGSWAGDAIYVVGDYADDWQGVPDSWKGMTYEEIETSEKGRKKKVKRVFGEEGNQTLYNGARCLCKDISDDIIRVVATAAARWGHPWATIDQAEDGWRDVPRPGVLPTKMPKKPIAGKQVYEDYIKQAIPLEAYAMEIVEAAIRCATAPVDKKQIIKFVVSKLDEIKAQLKKDVPT